MGEETKKDIWIGFDLGGTKMLATVYDEKFKPLGRKRRKTKGAEGAAAGLERVTKTIDEALADAKATPQQLRGIGVGLPGPLDLDKGIIIESANLGWKNVKLQQMLTDKYKCPAVLANDVDAGTFGEYRFGAGKGGRCVLGVFPGTGIGGGLIYEGKIFRGKTTSCLEFGHMMVDPRGRMCGCGRRGCLETVASRLAIAADVAMAAYRGESPFILDSVGTNIADIRSSLLADAVKAGDKVVEKTIRNAARRIGEAVANVGNLLAPDIVVLGGGLVEALQDIFLQEVRDQVAKRVMDSFAKSIQVTVAALGDDATALGAAALIAEKVAEEK
ncbi:MAG TPA: ROK family protein [Kiritimatiellia bacterium]|nr:ROK family protein [Kiritimatiellia bacterium]HMO97568.1 ROK family protein [Kiritimatiellia bacterium]HMP95946.1 ROK family protein [Kiritimatiellia bacterium]